MQKYKDTKFINAVYLGPRYLVNKIINEIKSYISDTFSIRPTAHQHIGLHVEVNIIIGYGNNFL